ncbi:hypothetical protein F442_18849 [Phytophthora nicotianae P10297]|uniref:FYVE-type domain-containing protein n=1 Tax=Phytophthora nicotianae P10297 TaxID=1317064 RepID=W2YBK8_PHYNI|nr:hypothetical protein F442_18849 [Phytophthora nicotianae P10297]
MNDPFFDEDDGEFDDLYGNSRPSASSASVSRKPRKSEVPAAPPVTPGGRTFTRSPAASSSVVSRSYVRDRAGSTTSNITDLAASGKQDKRRKRHGKLRRKSSQELFDVQWQSDVHVAKCGLCRADFSLVKRKHHCRHCGRVMCSDCSAFLYFELSHRKHRVCVPCNNQLVAEQEAYDRETLAGQRDTSVFDDSSEDGAISAVAKTPISSKSSDEKTKKKNEKNGRKEKKKREKLDKKGQPAQVTAPAPTPIRKQAGTEDKPSTTLFDGADDDWFTDVPERASTRDSEDSDGGSKGPGWRDHVKDTYTVTSASESVLAPMAGSTLTAGITENGYISDQFRYDVGGPGLGHEDDFSVEMPRPKHETATTYADHSIKPSRLTGNGYYSEQFQYDVGGPGLGHDDDRSLVMPRPKQQVVAVPYSYDDTSQSHDTSDESAPSGQDFQPRLTLRRVFSGTKRRESTAKREKKPRARGNESMTMDELNPSYSSEDEPRMAMPRPTATSAQPTFYDNDADKLVVDDSPGLFEATIAEREAQRKKEEEQQRQLASDMAWVNGSALPPSVPSHRFSSGQESYSIVDHPSHTSNSPVESRQGGNAGEDAVGNTKSGFAGALKRFFGMGSKSGKKATTPPKAAKAPPVTPVPEKSNTDKQIPAEREEKQNEDVMTDEPASEGLERHTVLDYYGATREGSATQESFRYTMPSSAAAKDASSRFEASMPPRTGASEEYEQVQPKPERKRRGTFDDLFESPKNNIAGNADRAANGWAARVGESTSAAGVYAAAGVGVSRFDRRRSVDEADDFTIGDESRVVQNPTRTDDPIAAWRQSAAMSLLNDRNDASQAEASGFTWSNVRSTPAFGTATYAIPTSLQPREDSSSRFDPAATQPAPLGNIMDDLNRDATLKQPTGKESVDDFFAEFEEPNDYVFDPATGGYVAARVPPRVAATRQINQSESPKSQPSQVDKDIHKSLERDYNAPIAKSAALTVASKDGEGEEVEDEVAEIIVDKISSLESELAALKQLIRNRKGSGGSNKPRVSHQSARPSVRKQSIFDNDSSDEDDGKAKDPYAASIRLVSKRESKRRPPSKKKHVKKRRDSFADLFEDSPNEKETLGGATSYEALFQTGAKVAEASKDEESDDDADLATKPTKKRSKSRRRSSRNIKDFVPAKEESDSEPEFTSLKERRGKQSRRKEGGDDDTGANSTNLVTPLSVDVVPVLMPVKQTEEEDPIDALFDNSNDRDVANLYGGLDEESNKSAQESKPAPILQETSALLAQVSSTSLTDDEVNDNSSSSATTMESVASVSKANGGFSYSVDPLNLDEANEEEAFSINWAKMRKTKSRRHKPRKSGSSKSIGDNTARKKATEDAVLEPSALDTNSEREMEVHDPAKREEVETSAPNSFLADVASNWMSVSTMEKETVNLSLTGDEDLEYLLQSEDASKPHERTSESAAVKKDDNADMDSAPVSMNDAEIQDISPNSSAKEVIPTEEKDDSVPIPLSKVSFVEELVETKSDHDKRDSGFDIFDKAGDVDFLSVSSSVDLNTLDHESNNEDEDKEALPDDEAFSFEVKPSKKRPSALGVPVSAPSTQQSSFPSLDESLELGKYAVSSVPSSSRTPSIDGSLDDPEEVSVDDEPVLGAVESHAFDADWQQMQAREKERKKKLQAKQRQAQRDKVLRKQGISSKSLSNSSATPGPNKTKKKKKKEKDTDDTTPSSSHHKKSRKHRHKEKGEAVGPPRSLTEL